MVLQLLSGYGLCRVSCIVERIHYGGYRSERVEERSPEEVVLSGRIVVSDYGDPLLGFRDVPQPQHPADLADQAVEPVLDDADLGELDPPFLDELGLLVGSDREDARSAVQLRHEAVDHELHDLEPGGPGPPFLLRGPVQEAGPEERRIEVVDELHRLGAASSHRAGDESESQESQDKVRLVADQLPDRSRVIASVAVECHRKDVGEGFDGFSHLRQGGEDVRGIAGSVEHQDDGPPPRYPIGSRSRVGLLRMVYPPVRRLLDEYPALVDEGDGVREAFVSEVSLQNEVHRGFHIPGVASAEVLLEQLDAGGVLLVGLEPLLVEPAQPAADGTQSVDHDPLSLGGIQCGRRGGYDLSIGPHEVQDEKVGGHDVLRYLRCVHARRGRIPAHVVDVEYHIGVRDLHLPGIRHHLLDRRRRYGDHGDRCQRCASAH